MSINTTSDIDRKTASKLLRVSVRTIDRYIRRGVLGAKQMHGRIFLDRSEVLGLNGGQGPTIAGRPMLSQTPVDMTREAPVQSMSTPSSLKRPESSGDDFYRDLYEEAKRTLGDYHQKLEQANYRIGQLETHSVHATTANVTPQKPTEVRIPQSDNGAMSEIMRRDIMDREKEIAALKEQLQHEKNSRMAFAVITYVLIILQPIFWYLLR